MCFVSPRPVSPRPAAAVAEARISSAVGGPAGPPEGGLQRDPGPGEQGEEEEERRGGAEESPVVSRPRRNLLASYMLTAFLSTLFTITD